MDMSDRDEHFESMQKSMVVERGLNSRGKKGSESLSQVLIFSKDISSCFW